MKLKDLQAFIPGWNIVYMVREFVSVEKQHLEMKRQAELKNANFLEDLRVLGAYTASQKKAMDKRDFQRAKYWQDKSDDLSYSRIQKILWEMERL